MLGFATAMLWVRSAFVSGELNHTTLDSGDRHAGTIGVQWINGHVCLFRQRDDVTLGPSVPQNISNRLSTAYAAVASKARLRQAH